MFLAHLTIIFAPLVGFTLAFSLAAVEAFFRKRVNAIYGGYATIFGILTSFLLSLKLLFTQLASPFTFLDLKVADWFSLGFGNFVRTDYLLVHWGFLFDSVTAVMCVVITSVSLLVHLYSMEYMSHDPSRNRFMSYLSLFVFFMLILVTADNYLQAFIGWEGVGLVSYLLISFWFMRVEAARSALKAVAINKIGDFGFVIALVFIFFYCHSLDYHTVYAAAPFLLFPADFLGLAITPVTLIGFFLLVAAVGKSAQLGLHTWLPDAMEGPTPVSALIHAATMVTAGVYLVVRSSPLLEFTPAILGMVAFLGASTALFGASTALFQNDLKKIIAYSTCSQLGYMFLACGFSAYGAAMFHLFTHAFFKALLFLGAGSVIHALADEQDIRRMGGLSRLLPFTYAIFTVGSFSLMGLPFLAGYYSKDYILEVAISSSTALGLYTYGAALLAAICTSAYSARLVYLTFLTRTNGHRVSIDHSHEPAPAMLYPLIFLVVLSVVAGQFFAPVFLSDLFWGSSILVNAATVVSMGDLHALSPFLKLLPTVAVLVAFVSVFWLYHQFNGRFGLLALRHPVARFLHGFFNKKWYFDHFYINFIIRRLYVGLYDWVFKVFERGLVTGTLVGLSINGTLGGLRVLKRLHSGYIYHYAGFVVACLTISVFFMV